MIKKDKKVLTLVAVVIILSLVGLMLASARLASVKTTKTSNSPSPTTASQRLYVRRGGLWPQLRWNLKALGDRLERPGQEQVTIAGTLSRPGNLSPAPVVLNTEAPNRINLTVQTGLQTQLVQYDGTSPMWEALSQGDRDLVETLLFDAAENFFFDQINGSATRCLGFRFRQQDGDTNAFHDIYAVTPRNNRTSVSGQGAKLFHFNSDTLLLDLVTYQIERNGRTVYVQVRLTDWQDTNGQNVARRIERLEDGVNMMTLIINSVVFAPGTPGRTI